VQQIIRPTGLLDPKVEVRPVHGQIDDLVGEITARTSKGERVLITTLTKRMAEDLSNYLLELGLSVHYLHSEIHALERVEILRDLRLGTYDVVVGINLLREGLDLPEVSLVAILDADKQGFLRSVSALIQTIGRTARHVNGHVVMYADSITLAMRTAIDETNRRRDIQAEHNKAHDIVPSTIVKSVRDITDRVRSASKERPEDQTTDMENLSKLELKHMIKELHKQMDSAAKALEFEQAALLRDQFLEMRRTLLDMDGTLD
jgi:excinuclease ABC subunit B